MKQMIQRMREEKGGFTLAELLIVVAIVAVLVAIAIPVFTAQLDKANAAVDEANARSGYGYVQSNIITETATTANGTYLLLADGSVRKSGETTPAGTLYVTKGKDGSIDGGVTLGGISVTWTPGQNIQYTVADKKVTEIKGVAVSNGS